MSSEAVGGGHAMTSSVDLHDADGQVMTWPDKLVFTDFLNTRYFVCCQNKIYCLHLGLILLIHVRLPMILRHLVDILLQLTLFIGDYYASAPVGKKNLRLDQVRCAGAHPHSKAFKPARVNPLKLAYRMACPITTIQRL